MMKIILSILTLTALSAAAAAEYHVDLSAKNQVKFISDAPIEDFEGVTDRIDGYVLWQGDSLREGNAYPESELYFEVELKSLDTGIGLRNRHMRENYLETDEFPFASYKERITEVKKSLSRGFIVVSEGNFEVHGVSKATTTVAEVTGNGKSYHVTSQFSVKLPDHQIDVPSLMFLKISEIIQLELDLYLKLAEINNK